MIDMPRKECLDLFKQCLIGRLSMIAPEGRPYTIPLRFVWHRDALFVRMSYDGRKQDSLSFTRRVCFEVDQVADDFSYYASALAEGVLLDLQEEGEIRAGLVAMNEKYRQLAGIPTPGPAPVVKGVALRKIVVESVSGRKHGPDTPDVLIPERLALRAFS
jgi:nitroimidazol reductase NimA-like FMN-containing flavoprotein (pyridoxamine 5'-phosphate oxidase superfamily)